MEWPRNDAMFLKENLDNVFVYQPRENRAVYQFAGDEYTTETTLPPEKSTAWLEEISARKSEPGLAVILASRAEPEGHNTSILEYLPFSRDEFERIVSILPLHGDTARLINRSDAPYFNDVNLLHDHHPDQEPAIFYYCRTTSAYPLDLAISSVFHPSTGFTAAVVFGCTTSLAEEIAIRLDNAEDTFTHPLLLYGILAEIEFLRHVRLVREKVHRLLTRVHVLNNIEEISSTSMMQRENYSVDLWIEVSQLRMALQAWRVELGKLDGCVEVFEGLLVGQKEGVVGDDERGAGTGTGRGMGKHKRQDSGVDVEFEEERDDKKICWRASAVEAGRRMRKRLGDIMREYDQKIGECTMVLDGMALSAQLSWSQIGYQDTQANLKIANDTRQDSSRMRSIAVLTMFFLPGTFIASLFSTTFFDFNAENPSNIISPYVWVYPTVTIAVTAIVVSIWVCFTARKRRMDGAAAALREKTAV